MEVGKNAKNGMNKSAENQHHLNKNQVNPQLNNLATLNFK